MISIDKLVEVGFTLPQATDISAFFRNIGYAAKFTATDLVDDFTMPTDGIIQLDFSVDALKNIFKSDTQYYKDIETMIVQRGNMHPNKSGGNRIIIYQAKATETDYGKIVDEFVKVNANWAQLVIDSRDADDIEKAGAKALANNRLFPAQTSDVSVSGTTTGNIAEAMRKLENPNVLLTYHKVDTEALAGGLASIMAQSQLGSVGALYSTVTNVMPQDYTPTVNANLDDQNVTYYSEINAVNGGGVSQYASPIVYGAYMINGEDAKRRYIRYALDLLLKAKSIDFLKRKLGYEDTSANILDSVLTAILIEGQRNNLVKKDTETKKGFELSVTPPSVLQDTEPILYNSETYRVSGYYRDSKTGRKVIIDLFIDPTEADLAVLLGKAA